jgi:hypothetical protein
MLCYGPDQPNGNLLEKRLSLFAPDRARPAAQLSPAKPSASIAQVEGSGTPEGEIAKPKFAT